MRASGSTLSREAALLLLHERRGDAQERTWPCRVGPVTLRFPNFQWRQRALCAHDLHHEMTGYPMTLRGEFRMAAWEMGAGRYPHWGATLFCAPLILMGLLWSPGAMMRAWRAGRGSRSLYPDLASPPAGESGRSDLRSRDGEVTASGHA